MNSLYEKRGKYGYLWSKHKRLPPCATNVRGQLFSNEKNKSFNSLFHSVYFVFSTSWFSIDCLVLV